MTKSQNQIVFLKKNYSIFNSIGFDEVNSTGPKITILRHSKIKNWAEETNELVIWSIRVSMHYKTLCAYVVCCYFLHQNMFVNC